MTAIFYRHNGHEGEGNSTESISVISCENVGIFNSRNDIDFVEVVTYIDMTDTKGISRKVSSEKSDFSSCTILDGSGNKIMTIVDGKVKF